MEGYEDSVDLDPWSWSNAKIEDLVKGHLLSSDESIH
jgi:hypothetical protein